MNRSRAMFITFEMSSFSLVMIVGNDDFSVVEF